MREFVVTLRSGHRYTVKAERFRCEAGHALFVATPEAAIGDLDPFAGVVALFDLREVAVVVARDHLVSQEQGEPIGAEYTVDSQPDSDIPF